MDLEVILTTMVGFVDKFPNQVKRLYDFQEKKRDEARATKAQRLDRDPPSDDFEKLDVQDEDEEQEPEYSYLTSIDREGARKWKLHPTVKLEAVTLDSQVCPLCPQTRTYLSRDSWRKHYRAYHLGMQRERRKAMDEGELRYNDGILRYRGRSTLGWMLENVSNHLSVEEWEALPILAVD